jgi:hypothetical protein
MWGKYLLIQVLLFSFSELNLFVCILDYFSRLSVSAQLLSPEQNEP